MGDRDLRILLVCRDIRQDLEQLRSLLGDDLWESDENLSVIDATIQIQEQKAYENLKQTIEQKRFDHLKDSIESCDY